MEGEGTGIQGERGRAGGEKRGKGEAEGGVIAGCINGVGGVGRSGSSMGRRRGKGKLGEGEVFERQGRGESPSLMV